MQVEYNNYKELNFACPKCYWAGKGQELAHGDFSDIHFIGNLECPKCFHLIAFWQAPLIDKSNEEPKTSS